MPRLIANAARVGIQLLPHLDRLLDEDFALVVDLAVEEAYAIRGREAEAAKPKGKGR